MILMGDDFHYQNADRWFANLDKLIKYANTLTNESSAVFAYSTPTCYLKALQARNLPLPLKTEDFFPYASDSNSYWTGYFTSKPDMKGDVRKSSAFLQLIRQFNALNPAPVGADSNLEEKLERAQSLSQHHDAITYAFYGALLTLIMLPYRGTSKHAVTLDYEKRIFNGWDTSVKQLVAATKALSQAQSGNDQYPYQVFCPWINETNCLFL